MIWTNYFSKVKNIACCKLDTIKPRPLNRLGLVTGTIVIKRLEVLIFGD